MMRMLVFSLCFFCGIFICTVSVFSQASEKPSTPVNKQVKKENKSETKMAVEIAVFAGGCFWCSESDFEKIPGVLSVESGYIGGKVKNPTYEQVSSGKTGHAEAVRVRYDAKQISYATLVEKFWKTIDPTVKDQQFCDKGTQYRSGIFYANEQQKAAALKSLELIKQTLKKKVYTEISQAGEFYLAEEYHQDYYKKNPVRYKLYRYRCGRDERLQEVWSK